MGRTQQWKSTGRGLIRMSWNKYNLYNLLNKTRLSQTNDKTLFQQQWQAKKETRGYHDSEITEKQWKKVFASSSKLPTSNTWLTGKLNLTGGNTYNRDNRNSRPHPHVASLTFAQLERRLDFILFRAHFATSVLEAKQLILHGKVTLNGEKVTVSSTMVADGDVVQVQPKSVPTLKGEKNSNLEFIPRPYSQPFLFLPPYLEVDYKTCSVVFLRSPTSRQGRTEIPSPYPPEVHALAYEFYATKK